MIYYSINEDGDFVFNIEVETNIFNLNCFGNRSSFNDTPKKILAMLNETQEQFAVLESATDIDIEISLMQNFVMDLLGRDSNSAAIFKAKTDEE